jgi:ABC-type transport system involved in cytochrome bd biosynthesis fused ATPase/permease subunit
MADFDLPFIFTICVSIIAVILTYTDMRRRLKQEREFSQSMANLINTLREELQIFRKQSMTSEDLKKQELLVRKEEQQWKQITDIAKGIYRVLKDSEENEDY